MSQLDSKALASAREVMALIKQEHIGGDVQLLAKIQNLFIEAMEYASPRGEPVSQPYKLPSGWIKCSERMPDEGAEVYIFCDSEWVLEAQYREGDFYDVVRDGSEIFETVSRCVSHWQPRPQKPAAPGKEG